jgi:endonuclease/exonuclease/phosphatase family metal-dependent hydrolase
MAQLPWKLLTAVLVVVSLHRSVHADLPDELRILTYNIHHGEGTDGKLDLPRIAEVIKAVSPHVVALQEVDQQTARSSGVDQPQELSRLTGMAVVFGRNIDFQGGGYGTAVLSKLPVKAHSSVKLPSFYDGEQRGVQVVELGSPGEQGLVLLCTHLDYRPDDRERMASAELINNLAANYGDRLMVLAGDLNAEPDSRVMRELEKRWSIASGSTKPQAVATTQLFTYPSGTPRKWIDFVLVRPAERWQVVEVRVLEEPVASDHRPLLAVLQPRELSEQSSNSENHGGAVTQRVTSKDGTTIALDQSGSGPPLVLVGGALSDRSSARRLAELLTPHFTVINYDRRGRGDSGDTAPYTVEREIEDIEALIDQAGGSAFVFGSSSGAVLALEAATKLPAAKVKKLALFEPPFIAHRWRRRWLNAWANS